MWEAKLELHLMNMRFKWVRQIYTILIFCSIGLGQSDTSVSTTVSCQLCQDSVVLGPKLSLSWTIKIVLLGFLFGNIPFYIMSEQRYYFRLYVQIGSNHVLQSLEIATISNMSPRIPDPFGIELRV